MPKMILSRKPVRKKRKGRIGGTGGSTASIMIPEGWILQTGGTKQLTEGSGEE